MVRVVKTPGIGLGISIAGGLGSVPYEGNDDVSLSVLCVLMCGLVCVLWFGVCFVS